MRISIDSADPGFMPELLGSHPRPRVEVFLDDVRQEAVITADDELGLIIAYERDGDGGWKHADGELIHIEQHGAVRIEGLT